MQEIETVTDKERLASLVEELTLEEQAVVIQLLQVVIGNRSKKHSITELRGLGKEIWLGIDADEYVNQERDAWSQ